MGIFDADDVITVGSLKEAIDDGVLVEIFRKRRGELSGGKPIVATRNLFENVSLAGLREIWNEFAHWKKHVENALPEEERLFATKMDQEDVRRPSFFYELGQFNDLQNLFPGHPLRF